MTLLILALIIYFSISFGFYLGALIVNLDALNKYEADERVEKENAQTRTRIKRNTEIRHSWLTVKAD
jgi:hypothetical protein